ncbi:MAG TPA: ethylbenzene dehydrogenase-related protein [Xanthobacteraceae bacterium]|nr:ethylbenzene dehydrogenase-related protein [Xanthobacteraceae bacterium]
MADIVARDDLSARPAAKSRSAGRSSAQRVAPADQAPRTDIGTLLLHWITAIAFFVSLFTGIRIAADALHAPVSKWLSPILPQGEIWTFHFYAGLTLFFCAAAYFVYMRRAALFSRNAFKKTRVMVMPVATKMRFGGLNVALHWAAYLIVGVMTVTGIFLYLGHGGWLLQIHSYVAFIGLAYIFIHALAHYLYGGWWQVFRVFRPAQLVVTQAVKPKPLMIAAGVGALVVAGIAASDTVFTDKLVIKRVAAAPDMKKLLNDPVWANVAPARIHTQQGINLGGTGESLVEVRAVHDGKKIYFAFHWEDPSRSTRREPLIKKEDGWHILADNTYTDDVTTHYEDKFAVIFSTVNDFGSGGVSHLGPKPLAQYQGSRNGRGFHYTDGHMVDMWQWKASRGGLLGEVDDMYIGPPRAPTEKEVAMVNRYQAGYWGDPGDTPYTYNFKLYAPSEYKEGQAVDILWLPKDYKQIVKDMGKWDPSPDASVDDGSKWWMLLDEVIPYSKEKDAEIPVGTIIPAVVITGKHEGDRYHLKSEAHWADGHWTLIVSRDLKTGSKYDQDFVPGKDLYMWVAVFDHTQTRHTRHPRPVKIVTQE